MSTHLIAFLRPRLKAGLIHLSISVLLAAMATAVIFLVWYPVPLAAAQGVSRLVIMLIGVDVVIGPLLTVVVFNRAKKSLRFDLAVIGTLQLAAFVYGMHSIFAGRPVFIVYNVDRFDLVAASELDTKSLERALAQGKGGPSWFGPRLIAALPPEDPKERSDILFSALKGGADLPQLAEWYVPYEQNQAGIVPHIRPLAELRKTNPLTDTAWNELLQSLGRPEAELGYLPMRANAKDGVVIVDSKTAALIRIELLEPSWK